MHCASCPRGVFCAAASAQLCALHACLVDKQQRHHSCVLSGSARHTVCWQSCLALPAVLSCTVIRLGSGTSGLAFRALLASHSLVTAGVATSKAHSLLAALQQQRQQLPLHMLSVQPQVSCEEAGGRLLGVLVAQRLQAVAAMRLFCFCVCSTGLRCSRGITLLRWGWGGGVRTHDGMPPAMLPPGCRSCTVLPGFVLRCTEGY